MRLDSKELLRKYQKLFYSGIFILAFITRAHYAYENAVVFNALDATEYIRNARLLAQYLTQTPSLFLDGIQITANFLPSESIEILSNKYAPLKEVITRSGPIYPLFLLLCMKLTGTITDGSSLFPVVLIQVLLNSVSCLFIAFAASRLWNRESGIATGILAAIYPGSIVNSARLISEPLAFFFLSMALALNSIAIKPQSSQESNSILPEIDKNREPEQEKKTALFFFRKFSFTDTIIDCFSGFLIGATLALLQLTRSALILVSGVFAFFGLVGFYGIPKKVSANGTFTGDMLRRALSGFSGYVFVLLTYAALQKIATGKGSVLVDRLSRYNLFVGVDLDARGWLAFPFSNFAPAFNNDHLTIISNAFTRDPIQFLELMASKMMRLFAYPWNDFKSCALGLPPEILVLIHQLILFAALAGTLLSFFKREPESTSVLTGRALTLSVFIVHSGYIFFESQARYAYSSIPAILIFAGAGLIYAIRGIRFFWKQKRRSVILSLIPVLGSLVLLTSEFQTMVQLYMTIPTVNHFYIALALVSASKLLAATILFYALYKVANHPAPLSNFRSSLFLAVCVLLSIFAIYPFQANGRMGEWSFVFKNGSDTVKQHLSANQILEQKNTARQNFLLIDLENWMVAGKDSEICINGRNFKPNFPLIPLMPLMQNLRKPSYSKMENDKFRISYELGSVTDSMLIAAGGKVLDLRQWFLIPIPEDIQRSFHAPTNKRVSIKLTNRSSLNKRIYGSYVLKKEQIVLPGLTRYSWDKAFYGIESAKGFSDMRFTEKYRIPGLETERIDLSPEIGQQSGNYHLRILSLQRAETKSNTLIPDQELELNQNKFQGTLRINKLPDPSDNQISVATVNICIDSKYPRLFYVPVEIIAKLEGKNILHNSPWVPSFFAIEPGLNQFHFSIPYSTVIESRATSSAGKEAPLLSSFTLSLIPKGRASGNHFFSTNRMNGKIKGNPKTTRELMLVVERDLRLKELQVKLYSFVAETPLRDYEIF